MTLLLDTHAFLWWRLDDRRLKPAARDAIATAAVVFVSAASGWEVAIKQALGRLTLKESFRDMVESSGFRELPVTLAHAGGLSDLPDHHGDPFDRMLVVQAHLERATLVTHDRSFESYDIRVMWT